MGHPPAGVVANAWNAVLIAALFFLIVASFPGLAAASVKTFTLTVEKKHVNIGSGMTYDAWTYDGTIPGPLLRVRQGEDVNIKLVNHTTDAHGINVHAAQISPEHFGGKSAGPVSYTFRAEVPGVFIYHCNAIPILQHHSRGMFGPMIVEPKEGWPTGDAQEVTLVQSEFYGIPDATGFINPDHKKMLDAHPDFVVFNGEMYKYGIEHPIPIKVGKPVRLFFINAGPNLTSSFHIAGVIFRTVYWGGNPANALHGIEYFDVGPSEGAVFEFQVNEPGDYRFMDLERAHQYKGAMGVFRAAP